MTKEESVDSFLTVINAIKSGLDDTCDSISPFTGNKRVIETESSKLCLDTGYRCMLGDDFVMTEENTPEYIRNSTIKDDSNVEWVYTVLANDTFLLQPAAFTDDTPKKAKIWGLNKLNLIVDTSTVDMSGAIMLNDDWYTVTTTYFETFIDAFVAYNILATTYTTDNNVN